jgi:mannan endo-1,4-beta-mannosidase
MNRFIALLSALAVYSLATVCAAGTANPNATAEAKALLQYLVDISGKKILSGQESMYSDGTFPSRRDAYVYQRVNKYPALYTSDFGDVGKDNLADRNKAVSNAVAYHNKGSIVAFQYHMIQPDLADGSGFSAMNIKGSTYTKIPDILTEGSSLNKEFNKRLDELAGYFKTLETNKIAVLYRPFHEMNGDFFWWSFQDRFKDLWKYTFKYLTTTKKCNNLLWVFGVNWYAANSTGKSTPGFYYPGHEYVDVLACDFYTEYGHSFDKGIHDTLRALGGGKPIAIAENGTMPNLTILRQTQPYWAYWCTWWGFEGADKKNYDTLYTKNYGLDAVITQDEVSIPTTAVAAAGPAAVHRGRTEFRFGPSVGATLVSAGDAGCVDVFSAQGKRIGRLSGRGGTFTLESAAAGTYLLRPAGAGAVKGTVAR